MRKVVWTTVFVMAALGMPSGGASAQSAQDPQPRVERRQTRRQRGLERLGQRAQTRMARVDRDHDGVVSRDEWPGAPQRFERLDRNRDGVLSSDEVVRGMAARRLLIRRLARRLAIK